MKNKKILLTGTPGFLGDYIYKHIYQQNKVTTLSFSNKSDISVDISKSFKLTDNFDIVIHCAGKAHIVPKTEKEKKSFFDINYKGTVNLCNSLPKIPKQFIFISSVAVYGKTKGELIDENEELAGKTPYAKSKIMAERFLQKWADKNNVNLIILRLPLLAGKNPKGNLASMINGIKKGYYFNISRAKAKKSIVLAEDIAKLISNIKTNQNGTYNLSGKKDYTLYEISNIIAKQLSKNKIYNLPYFLVKPMALIGDLLPFFPINSNKLKKMVNPLTFSSEKAKKQLGWSPSSLEEKFKI